MNFTHPWIDESLDDGEMEAVLVASDSLPSWEPGQIIRAFQTHQWSNASTDGDRVCFAHEETGTIVCHDGKVVGIECGHGELAEALPDLISVLSDLGWQGAYVFCLAAHMNGFIADIGRSIPAHLEFDVKEAKRGTPVGDLPEAQSLLDHGRDVLRAAGGAAGGSGTAAIFNSLEETGPVPLLSEPCQQSAIILEGEDALDTDNEIPIAPSFAVKPVSLALSSGDDDGAPRVFNFSEEDTAGAAVPQILQPAQSFDTHAAPGGDRGTVVRTVEQADPGMSGELAASVALARQELQVSERNLALLRLSAEQDRQESMQKDAVIETLRADVLRLQSSVKEVALLPSGASSVVGEIAQKDAGTFDGLLRVGKSAFYFGVDGQVDMNAVDSIAGELGCTAVVHLWPGELRQSVRWDVLGEIDPEAPLFADTFVRWAFPDSDCSDCECGGTAAWVLSTKRVMPFASLRDLLQTTDKTIKRALNALSLTENGYSFVDLRKSVDDLAEDMQEAFTVREVMLSSASRLFVVHVDSLDGPFVRWVVDLLRKIVVGYASSARCEKQLLAMKAEELPAEPVAEVAVTQDVKQEVATMMGEFMQKLQALGVTVA